MGVTQLPPDERRLIGVLTAINFTHLVDFVIMMPLGPQLMEVFGITAREFAVAVSAYAFASAVAAIIGVLLIDRFERKRALLTLYAGCLLATLGCALAPTFAVLVLARAAAGACGGLLGALIMAIVGERIPYARRGAAMGMVMSAFSIASVLGVPAGVWLAHWLNWHVAFLAIAAVGTIVFTLAWLWLPVMREHQQGPVRSSAATLRRLVQVPAHWWVLAFTAALVTSGFVIIPYIAVFLSRNIGLGGNELGTVYLVGGAAAFIAQPRIGRLADRFGKHRVFAIVALVSIIPTLVLTWLPPVPVAVALLVTTAFIVCGSGRFVPASTLMTAAVEPDLRGAFMSLNAAVQALAMGLAPLLATLVITQASEADPLQGYGRAGLLSVAAVLVCLLLVRRMPGGR